MFYILIFFKVVKVIAHVNSVCSNELGFFGSRDLVVTFDFYPGPWFASDSKFTDLN